MTLRSTTRSTRPTGAAGMLVGGVLLLLLPGAGSGCAREPVEVEGPQETFAAYLDAWIPQLLDAYDVPGASLALVQDGRVVWSGAYGYADLERARRMTTGAVFRVESISKSVTAWGVMRLVEQGRVDLDAPVQRYFDSWTVPESGHEEQAVTVRRLLRHDAGMPLGALGQEYAPGSDVPALRDYLTREAGLARPPGSGFSYSNVGFNVLELLVEEVSGRDFAAYMTDEVLRPLGMRASRFGWEEALRPEMPTGYERNGAPVPAYVYPAQAAGGLLAPVEDVARFVCAEMTGTSRVGRGVLAPASVRALHTPRVDIPGAYGVVADAYGFGHFVETLPDGRRAVWHGGQGHGWMTHFHAVPAAGAGIVILTNSERSWPFLAQVLDAWARWSGFGPVKMSRITTATRALRVLAGLVVLSALAQAYRLLHGLHSGRRRLAPQDEHARLRRALQALLGLSLAAVLAWAAAQPYLMLASVFPRDIGWTGAALLTAAAVLVLSALLPASDNQDGWSRSRQAHLDASGSRPAHTSDRTALS